MKHCEHCGAELPENLKFCEHCGTAVTVGETPPPPAANPQVYAAIDGQQSGPYDDDALRALVKQGRFSRATPVWTAGMDGWKPAGETAALAAIFAPPPPPGAAPPATASAPAAPKERQTIPPGFVKITAGKFTMGSPEYEGEREKNGCDETPHQVTLDQFYLAAQTVTVADFRAFVEATGFASVAEREGTALAFVDKKLIPVKGVSWKDPHFLNNQKQADDHPAVALTFEDCILYCNWLSDTQNLDRAYTVTKGTVVWHKTANGYRLPAEAEWEYACRAGTRTAYWFGGVAAQGKAAQYGGVENATVPANSFPPNAWGLYNMHGNIFEWCWDWYAPYETGAKTNPAGPGSGTERVCRGGSWCSGAGNLRSACRVKHEPGFRSYHTGFRLALNGYE